MDSLKRIFLDQNFSMGEEGDEGITNLANMLSYLKNIEEVSIANIGFTQKGAFYLLQKIAKHQSLSQLNMCCNYIQGDISDSFFNVMETCPNLTDIAVSGNDVKWPKSSEREQRLIENGWRVCDLSPSEWKKHK